MKPPLAMMTLFASTTAAIGLDSDLALALERARAVDHVDLVLLEQELDAPDHAVDDLAAAVDGRAEVEAQVVVADAELLGAAEEADDLGVVEERLGGDAAPVEADAADAVLLDEGSLQAELGRPDRGDVAAGPAADDSHVVVCHEGPSRRGSRLDVHAETGKPRLRN